MTTSGEPSGGETLRSDAILVDPLAIPPGVAEWLRENERRVRDALASLQLAAGSTPVLAITTETLDEAHDFLEAASGQLSRLLKRPLVQLTAESVARRGFDRAVDQLIARADRAGEAERAAHACVAESEGLTTSFSPLVPLRLEELRKERRAEHDRIATLRRRDDVERFRSRVGAIRAALTTWIRQADGAPRADLVNAEFITATELAGRYSTRMSERRSLQSLASIAPRTRAALARQIGLLTDLTATGAPGESLSGLEPLVDASLHYVVAANDGLENEWDDAPLWAIATLGINNRRFGATDEFSFRPAVWVLPDFREFGGVVNGPLRVVPLDEEFAFVGADVESPIRVWNPGGINSGNFECAIAPDDVHGIPGPLAALDLQSLFDGLDLDRTRWYVMGLRPRLEVVASAGSGKWYARVVRRGTIEPESTAPWSAGLTSASFLVVLPPSRLADGTRFEEVAKTQPEPLTAFLGLGTFEVLTGMSGHARALVRGPSTRWTGAAAAITREHKLFSRMDRTAAGTGLRTLAMSRLRGGKTTYPLYATPVGFHHRDVVRLRGWIATSAASLFGFVQSAARSLTAAHDAGFAVGVVALESFAISISARAESTYPAPVATLVQAPLATELGTNYGPAFQGTEDLILKYPILGAPLVTPPSTERAIATPQDDMFGFAAMLLDLLLARPPVGAPTEWRDILADHAFDWGTTARNAGLARILAGCLQSEEGREQLLRACREMAGGQITGLRSLEQRLVES